MHLKKYRRPTVKDALRAVREELGPAALVLSTELVPVAGVKGWLGRKEVEITAGTFEFQKTAEQFPIRIQAVSNTNLILDTLRMLDEKKA